VITRFYFACSLVLFLGFVPMVHASAIGIFGKYAYLVTPTSGVAILEVSEPQNPIRVGAFPGPLAARSIAVARGRAFVGDDNGLRILDLRDPDAPSELASLKTKGSARDVAISGKYVYLAEYDAGLEIIDVTDPSKPVSTGNYDAAGLSLGLAVVGDLVYLADGSEGLVLIDVHNPTNPRQIGNYKTAGEVRAVDVFGNYAYLAAGEQIEILDISNRSSPVRVGIYSTTGPASGVTIVGELALVTDSSGMQLVDVRDKANPVKLAAYSSNGLTGPAMISYVRPAPESAPAIILDCDPGNDIDDIGDLAIMHALADRGELNIVAEMYSMRPAFGAPDIEVANRFYGRSDLPIGVSKTSTWDAWDNYGSFLQTNYYNSVGSSANAPDAVTLYREILSTHPDHSLDVLCSGQLRNIYELWKTQGDSYSPLSGPELFAKKVRRLVVVAGVFPSGYEFNMYVDPGAAAILNYITNGPQVTFVGIELGNTVSIGQSILTKPESDPIRAAYDIFYKLAGISERPGWASLGLLFVARGYTSANTPLFTAVKGQAIVNVDGSNGWATDVLNPNQEYLLFAQAPSYYRDILNDLLMQPPISDGSLYAFISDQDAGAKILDITNRANPVLTGGYTPEELPRLELSQEGPILTFRWPDRFDGFQPERAANLSGTWTSLMPEIQQASGYYSFTATNAGSMQFFRIYKP
jgi:hypothetical protein